MPVFINFIFIIFFNLSGFSITVPLRINLTGNAERNALHIRSISVLLSVLYPFYTRSIPVPNPFQLCSLVVPLDAFHVTHLHEKERVPLNSFTKTGNIHCEVKMGL